jgi:2-hydroxychromene-2-carboxylate isomerase
MTLKNIYLYAGYTSPFAYLAKDPAYQLESDFDVVLQWRPYSVSVEDTYGDLETRRDAQWRKVRYLYMDLRRHANKRGITVRGPQKIFEGRVCSVGALFAQRQGTFRPYNDAVFTQFWNRELDVDDRDAIRNILAQTGSDTADFFSYLDGEGQLDYLAVREEAHAKGVFGVPTFELDGELFWGYDRIPLVRERLTELGCARAETQP